MDVLDEKANGAIHMETEEIVSVRDRESPRPYIVASLSESLPTDEAFAAKHMPDLGHDVKDFKVFSWHLSGWKKLDKKLTSPEFECGGHKWCVLSRLVGVSILHRFVTCIQADIALPLWQLERSTKRHCVCVPRLRRTKARARGLACLCSIRARDLKSP